MNWIEALILGVIQGLTEFLPVSSSGHLELGKIILGVNVEESLTFTVVVHGATVLSTIIVFWKDIIELFTELFKLKWNEGTQYIAKIFVSMIPVLFVGFLLEEQVESLFTGKIVLVGAMLIFTATLLTFTYLKKSNDKSISFGNAFIIGIAQALAVIPGISRSGSTIATGLILGNKKTEIAKFSFLMVLVPIIGANLKDVFFSDGATNSAVTTMPLIIGFIAAFITGLVACKLMINIVRKGKLVYFAIYCLIVGAIAIFFGL